MRARRLVEPARGFEAAEFAERTANAQRLMSKRGIDLLWFSTEPELRYFSGFHSPFWQSPTRPWFLLIPPSGKPIAIVPSIGATAFAQTWLDDVRSWSSPCPEDEGLSLLLQSIEACCPPSATIGTLMGSETHVRMPLDDLDVLRRGWGARHLVDATEIVRELRGIKSPAELDKIRHICAITSAVFEQLPDWVSCGDSPRDIFQRFKIEMLRAGADDVSYLVGGAGPGGYEDIISPPSGRATQAGDVLMLDTGAVFDGYFCDFDRNYVFSQRPDPQLAKAQEALWLATEAGFACAVPGATAADVFAAMQAVLERLGYAVGKVGRMGHGLGMQLTEWPSIAAFDHTELKANMVLTLEPSIEYGPHKMLVHEENIVLLEGGAAYLSSRAPFDLPVIV